MKKTIIVVVLVLVAALLLWPKQENRSVQLLLDWTPNTNHTGIFVALEQGWYEEEGIDLKIITPQNTTVEAVVGAGKVDFGISFQEYVTSSRLEGVPIVSIAAVIQHNTAAFVSLKDSGIETPRNFVDKRYGGWGLPIEQAILKSMINFDGGKGEPSYVQVGSGDLLRMLGRDMDFAQIFYGWQGIEAKLRKLPLNVMAMADYFEAVPDYYTPVIITSEGKIEKDPKLVKKFLAATARGYKYAEENPDRAAEILIKYLPDTNPKLIRESQKWLSPRYRDDAPRWGEQKEAVWEDFGNWLYKNQLIPGKLDAKAAFTNAFLPRED